MQFKQHSGENITLNEIKEVCADGKNANFYFSNETSKDKMSKLKAAMNKINKNTYIKKLNLTLEEDDYLYSISIV